MPIEILVNYKTKGIIGPNEGEIKIEEVGAIILWSGDSNEIVSLIVPEARYSQQIPVTESDKDRVFIIKTCYPDNPFCQQPIYFNNEVVVRRT